MGELSAPLTAPIRHGRVNPSGPGRNPWGLQWAPAFLAELKSPCHQETCPATSPGSLGPTAAPGAASFPWVAFWPRLGRRLTQKGPA